MAGKDNQDKNKKETKSRSEKPVPVLFEVMFTISKIGVMGIGLLAAGISLFSGNDLISSVFRSMAAMLVVGILLWFLTWLVVRGSFNTLITSIKQANGNLSETTKDIKA